MLKVLIVDDEKLIRIAMRNIVNWKELNCEVIGYEKDGLEALKVIDEIIPDIIITDLKMPNLDGIELIKEVKRRNLQSKVIVLSNHGDYDLVRMAMKEGAFDYLLKVTIEGKDIEGLINQISKEIENNNLLYKDIESFDIEDLKKNLLLMINQEQIDEKEFLKCIDNEEFKILDDNFNVSYFKVDNIDKIYKDKIKEHSNLKKNIENIIYETIYKEINYKIVFIKNHSGIIIFGNSERNRLININSNIVKNIKQYLNITMSIALSKEYNGKKSFRNCFSEIVDLFQWRFYLGEESVIDCSIIPKFKYIDYTKIKYPMEIVKNVREREFSNNSYLVDKIIDYSIKEEAHPKYVKEVFIFILANIEGNELQKGFKNVDKFNYIRKFIEDSKDILILKAFLREEFKNIENWINDANNRTYRKEIEDIINYIDKNIERKISLKMLSKTINMNESYLSRIFKNETGKNITYFINERKMNRALELLSNKSIMIKEASLMVGIDDQFYFNKLFKKFYGINPSEFKKKCYK